MSASHPLQTLQAEPWPRNLGAMSTFLEAVTREAEVLLKNYGLQPRALAANDVLLVGSKYALRFRVDRDGVTASYVDADSGATTEYELFGFLSRERGERLVFEPKRPAPANETAASLAALVRHLRAAGEDILSGDKDWQAEHGFAVLVPSLAKSLPELAS